MENGLHLQSPFLAPLRQPRALRNGLSFTHSHTHPSVIGRPAVPTESQRLCLNSGSAPFQVRIFRFF